MAQKKTNKRQQIEELDNKPAEPGKTIVVYMDSSKQTKRVITPTTRFTGNPADLVKELHGENYHSFKVL